MKIDIDTIDQIMNSMTFPVIIIDLDKKISIINIAGENFLKSSSKMILGKSIESFLPFSSPLMDLISKCKSEELGFNEYGLDLSNPMIGERIDIDVQVTRLNDEKIMIIFIDNSFERNFLFRGQSNTEGKTLSYFGSMLAHEVKNPLAGIRGAAQLIEKQYPQLNNKLTSLICNEVDRIKRLIENIETFDTPHSFDLKPLNIHSILRHTSDVVKNSQEIKLEINEYFDPSIPNILGNKDQLIQLFLNLMTNSCDAITEENKNNKSKIARIDLFTSFQHNKIFKNRPSGEKINLPIEIRVSDNGSGIIDSYQKNIFKPFVSSKKSSKSGLGLAMVKKIIDDHNGTINFVTSPEGTTFSINLSAESF
ncbi:MAG: two-component system sensor histidine kinase NtrB [Alphaproteobacteria bacterium]